MGKSNRNGRDIDSALRKKGFWRDKSGDHFFYFYGSTKIKTKMSHGTMGDSIGAGLISRMSRQLHLSKERFLDLIDCNLDAAGYRAIIEPSDGGTEPQS
ncbi:MAG: hypothetical protein LBI05_04340 [Planctomycetaceae bacterium]|jgi:hypothetical protein|nr:hypothetical protein [Planctomycetaceae bacterium]